MPNIANPHKKFQFSIQLDLMDPFLAQEVTTPSVELEIVEHGDSNHMIKTAGMPKYGNLVIRKISKASIDPLNNWVWDWVQRIQDPFAQGGDTPDEYKVNAEIVKFATDGETIIGKWEYEGVWPCKINGIELSRMSSDNTIEELEFCLDKQRKTL